MFKGKFIIRMLMLVISILRQKNKKLKQRIKILEGRYWCLTEKQKKEKWNEKERILRLKDGKGNKRN